MSAVKEIRLTGGSFPFKINGKEFNARCFHDQDYAELDAYVQFRILEESRDRIRELSSTLDPSEKQEWQAAAIKAASSASWNSAEGSRVFRELTGICRLGWQMIKDQNSIKFDDFIKEVKCGQELVTPEIYEEVKANAKEIERIFQLLNIDSSNGDGEDKGDSSDEPKSD